MSFVEVASVADQEMWEITTLSCDENFTMEANRVVESCQPRRMALNNIIIQYKLQNPEIITIYYYYKSVRSTNDRLLCDMR